MEILKIYDNPARPQWADLTRRCTRQEGEIAEQVAGILAQVREGGDEALRRIVRRIEGRTPEAFEIPADIRRKAAEAVSDDLKKALAAAKANIEAFHRAQLPQEVRIETMPGVRCMQRAVPIRRVGLYVPGGQAPLFSTMFSFAARSRISPSREIPFPNMISNSASLKGGAILFLTTFTRTWLPTISPPCLSDSVLLTSRRTDE